MKSFANEEIRSSSKSHIQLIFGIESLPAKVSSLLEGAFFMAILIGAVGSADECIFIVFFGSDKSG